MRKPVPEDLPNTGKRRCWISVNNFWNNEGGRVTKLHAIDSLNTFCARVHCKLTMWLFHVLPSQIVLFRWRCSSRLQIAASPCARAIDRFSRSGQSGRRGPAAPIRTRKLSSRLSGQRRILTHFGTSRWHTHASLNITLKGVPFPI